MNIANSTWMDPAVPSRTGRGLGARLWTGLAAAGRGLLAAASYAPFLPASISLLAAAPDVRLRAVRWVREREREGVARPRAIRAVAQGIGLSAGTVGSWMAIADRDGRGPSLVVRRSVRAIRTGVRPA